ncbi:hypothetical protein PVL29_022300 [Vitis rotundifolia]|uniref:Sulfotransferase n=1 Tax=Vitis rotundifolia TaxID=103349 RepID=A0AA38YV19_VITRO|nr:hypothetical protein PVL29_022300 [Vitis rotundifolia]
MATVHPPEKSSVREDEDDKEKARKRNNEIISGLGKEEGWMEEYTYEYQGFWYPSATILEGVMWVQQNFKPRHEDILLVTLPKSGTTWFKPLMFAVMNRTHFDLSTHPLLTTSPHDLVPFLELYLHHKIPFPNPDTFYPPQLFQTHIPFTSLSQYVMESQCRIVYICRNPKDVFVSTFYFLEKVRDKKLTPLSLEKALELFCKGLSLYGPFWDHVLGYWKASLEVPDRVLFLKYEDMKRDSSFHLKRLAEFMGYPFSVEEEKQGVAHDILELCSFENLRNLKVNKTGNIITSNNNQVENHRFFRKGEVGDWKRHLTAEMEDGLNKLIEQKLAGSGLAFRDSSEA